MDKRSLFGEVDRAVMDALDKRSSVLDTYEVDEWTPAMLKSDAEDVRDVLARVVEAHGWTLDDYNYTLFRTPANRHTPHEVAL